MTQIIFKSIEDDLRSRNIVRADLKKKQAAEQADAVRQIGRDLRDMQPLPKMGLIKEAMRDLPPEMLEEIRREAFDILTAAERDDVHVVSGTYQMGRLPLPDPEKY